MSGVFTLFLSHMIQSDKRECVEDEVIINQRVLVHTPWTLKFSAALPSLRNEALDSSPKLKATWTCLLGYKYENRRNFNNSRVDNTLSFRNSKLVPVAVYPSSVLSISPDLFGILYSSQFWRHRMRPISLFKDEKKIFREMRKYSWERTRDKFLGKIDYKMIIKFFGQLNHIWNA